jgi:hypothetical protein
MYTLLQKCQYKLSVEASHFEPELRVLVGHANLFDDLREELAAHAAWARIFSDIRGKCGNDVTTNPIHKVGNSIIALIDIQGVITRRVKVYKLVHDGYFRM